MASTMSLIVRQARSCVRRAVQQQPFVVMATHFATSSNGGAPAVPPPPAPVLGQSKVIDDLFQLLEKPSTTPSGQLDLGRNQLENARAVRSENRASLDDLKYWKLYPPLIRKWVTYTKSSRGHFDSNGNYYPSGKFDLTKRLAAPLMRPVEARSVDFVADSDLAGHYRFGIPAIEMATMHPKLKRILSMEYASKPEILKFRNRNLVAKWGDTVEDTGKSEVQIACMTQRIKFLSEHLIAHRKDRHSAMGLKRLVGRRRRLMKYLKSKSVARYYKLIADLELRDL